MKYQIDYKILQSDKNIHSLIIDAYNKKEAKNKFLEINNNCKIIEINKI